MGTVRRITTDVFRISLAWSNAYLLLEGDQAALIDTGLRKDRPALLAALQEIGVTEAQVRAVYLTHAHCDHAGNVAYFQRGDAQARISLHRAEARFLGLPRRSYGSAGWRQWTRPGSAVLFAAGERFYPVARCSPDSLLEDGESLDAPGGPLRVVASPGHTPGHIAFYRERDRLLFSGDAVLNIIPIKRVTGLSLAIRCLSDDWEECKRSAVRLADLEPAMLLAGHGRPLLEDTARSMAAWARTLR